MPVAARRRALAVAAVPVALLVEAVASAGPAGAHNVGGGSLPAPPWLLSYIGAFAVALTAVGLRSAWAAPRWTTATPDGDVAIAGPDRSAATDAITLPRAVGLAIGVVLFGGVLTAAIIGPDSNAANIAPVAVFAIWWVGVPMLCLLVGDVVRAINPFVGVAALVERLRGTEAAPTASAPAWTGAAFLAGFSWFFLAYHRPGSPRSLAIMLVVYAVAALAGGHRWGRRWLETGEGFGALSRGISQISLRRRHAAPPGLLPLVVVWLGGTCYDALSSTTFWIDVQGTSQGWSRTFLNTVGLVWMTAIVAGAALLALRLSTRTDAAEDSADRGPSSSLAGALGLALVPVALAWFVAHDLTFFLATSQDFYALASDPIGKGWDLFGTIGYTIDYSIVRERWVRWVQLGALLVGHAVAVVLAHDGALVLLGRRRGMRATWAVTAALAGSIVAAALLVIE